MLQQTKIKKLATVIRTCARLAPDGLPFAMTSMVNALDAHAAELEGVYTVDDFCDILELVDTIGVAAAVSPDTVKALAQSLHRLVHTERATRGLERVKA